MENKTRAFTLGLFLAVFAVATADLAVRAFETRLSGDIANIKSFPGRVTALSEAPGKRVAAIGNSLIGDGLDTEIFMASWLDKNPGVGQAIKLVPDGSGIWEWHCIVHYQLNGVVNTPDMVIIGFGWNQLSDQSPLSLTRAFNSLCPAGAMRDFSALSKRIGINDWLEMLTVKTSKLYAHREPIRHRTLQNIVPDYRRMTRRTNARAGQAEEVTSAHGSPQFSYAALERVLGQLSSVGTQVILVAMPVMEPYEIDRGLCDVVSGTPHELLDMRYAVPSRDSLYRDNLHLNKAGARIFSETLAAQLRAPWPSMSLCST